MKLTDLSAKNVVQPAIMAPAAAASAPAAGTDPGNRAQAGEVSQPTGVPAKPRQRKFMGMADPKP